MYTRTGPEITRKLAVERAARRRTGKQQRTTGRGCSGQVRLEQCEAESTATGAECAPNRSTHRTRLMLYPSPSVIDGPTQCQW